MAYDILRRRIDDFAAGIDDGRVRSMFLNCFFSTLDTTTEMLDDGTAFIFTGDIPAMWLRDSSMQVAGYLPHAAQDPDVKRMIAGLLLRQYRFIMLDPYANAFNHRPHEDRHIDQTDFYSDFVWERKYEIDSLCFPLWLTEKYYAATADTSVLGSDFLNAFDKILQTFKTEQSHDRLSPYFFRRDGQYHYDTLENGGKGSPTAECGLTWSGFRPSDDRCMYHYLIPSNFFAASAMEKIAELLSSVLKDSARAGAARTFAAQVREGIKNHAVVTHPQFGEIYAYETDGMGNYNLMDDANVPSLLSLPYLGCCEKDDPIYQNTRRFVLSKFNPYYFEGRFAKGIGSPHTPKDHIWPIALVMQLLTSGSREEAEACFEMLISTDAGCGCMHESFHKDDPAVFTREWFAWANTLFGLAAVKMFSSLKSKL